MTENSLTINFGTNIEGLGKLEREIYQGVGKFLSTGLEIENRVTQRGDPSIFIGLNRLADFLGEPFFSAKVGIVSSEDVFRITRDGAKSLKSPSISGQIFRDDGGEHRTITLEITSDRSNPYDHKIIEGIDTIKLDEMGNITGHSGVWRKLSAEELTALKAEIDKFNTQANLVLSRLQ